MIKIQVKLGRTEEVLASDLGQGWRSLAEAARVRYFTVLGGHGVCPTAAALPPVTRLVMPALMSGRGEALVLLLLLPRPVWGACEAGGAVRRKEERGGEARQQVKLAGPSAEREVAGFPF